MRGMSSGDGELEKRIKVGEIMGVCGLKKRFNSDGIARTYSHMKLIYESLGTRRVSALCR